MKRSIRKVFNNYKIINQIISQDEQQLSDKLKNIELSHKRKVKLLRDIQNYLINCHVYVNESIDKFNLLKRIDQELEFIGRINYGANK